MTISLPAEPLFILGTLQSHGYEVYIVGGAVRDLIVYSLKQQVGEKLQPLDKTITDYDFTTNATPEQILAIFPESFYENQFGTVSIAPKHLREMMGMGATVVMNSLDPRLRGDDKQETEDDSGQEDNNVKPEDDKETRKKVIDVAKATKIHVSLSVAEAEITPTKQEHNYEITTFRSEGSYEDHRRPSEVKWGKTLEDDLSRRDFTINAMAIKVAQPIITNWLAENQQWILGSSPRMTAQLAVIELNTIDYKLIDLYGGMKDLADGIIKTVGDPAQRFEEDALRMLRAIRFCVQLKMKMTDEVFAAISGLAEDINHVSWERIRDEFLKMLASSQPKLAIELLDETGLLHFLLPELREGKGMTQGGHHTTDVWTHSLDALDTCPSKDPIVRFATLLHDVAKPRTVQIRDREITFYSHEILGARVAYGIAQRFRLPKKDCDRIFTLVRYHMFYYQTYHTDAAVRRFMRNVGLENVDDILDLREGDRLGSGARQTSWRLEEMKARMIEQLHQPFAITDLAIDGNDLMTEFVLKPGPQIGKILKTLFEEVLEKPELNQKEILLEKAKGLLDK